MPSSPTPESGTWRTSRARGARPVSRPRAGERQPAGARDRFASSSRSRRPRRARRPTRIVRGNLEASRYASPGGIERRSVLCSCGSPLLVWWWGFSVRFGLLSCSPRWGGVALVVVVPCLALGPALAPSWPLGLTWGGYPAPPPTPSLGPIGRFLELYVFPRSPCRFRGIGAAVVGSTGRGLPRSGSVSVDPCGVGSIGRLPALSGTVSPDRGCTGGSMARESRLTSCLRVWG